MGTTVVLVTRDLRVHDNPALAGACASAEHVVPLFVVDPSLPADPRRRAFLAGSLVDMREALRERGGDLLVRHGDPVAQAMEVCGEVGATGLVVAEDVSGYAGRRQRRLAGACRVARVSFTLTPGVTVVPPAALHPYRVFTPYWRAWRAARWRAPVPAPARVTLPPGVRGDDPARILDVPVAGVPRGGENAGRRRLREWSRRVGGYGADRDALADDATSRLSPYLHFGCVSPLAVVSMVDGAEEFVRQVCWRDFYHQVLASFPALTSTAYRPGTVEKWRNDPAALDAWRTGHTGLPIVDAGMRQLAAEGWLPNRARLITAGYLTKVLGLDWRDGADWYARSLVDADVANNWGNWQWVAGTGNDPRPYRRINPIRQGHRFDPDGRYVRRWVPELAGIAGGAVHELWRLPRRPAGYPPPLEHPEQRW